MDGTRSAERIGSLGNKTKLLFIMRPVRSLDFARGTMHDAFAGISVVGRELKAAVIPSEDIETDRESYLFTAGCAEAVARHSVTLAHVAGYRVLPRATQIVPQA